MIGVGTIQAMITSLMSNRIEECWRKPFSKKIRRKGVTALRWEKARPEVLKAIKSKIRKQNRVENLMYTCLSISVIALMSWYI